MEQQKYLNDIIDKAILYLKEVEKNKNDFSNMFNNDDTSTLLEFVESLNDEQLYDYFKISQISLDLHNIFTEIGSFIHFCKKIGVELDLSVLNKSDKLFKESTMYEDYAINEELFHWQSQSRTTVNSASGRRYINMKENKSRVLLLIREEKSDSYGATETFKCLGLASYVSHEGSAPISIIYKLESKMPMNILRSSNQVVNIWL